MSLPNILWEEYAKQLQHDYPLEQYPNYPAHYAKIRKFYALAEKIAHGQIGTPPLLRFNYQRLQHFLQTLDSNCNNDNPIKQFFPHDYDHRSETYAYLNVVTKTLFGQKREKNKPLVYVCINWLIVLTIPIIFGGV